MGAAQRHRAWASTHDLAGTPLDPALAPPDIGAFQRI